MTRKLAFVFAMVFLLAVLSPGCNRMGGGAIGVKATPLDLDDEDKTWLLAAARTLLEDGPRAELPPPSAGVDGLCGREVWISVHRGGAKKYASEIGLANCVVDGMRKAAGAVRQSREFKSEYEGRLAESRVKVDILEKTRDIRPKRVKRLYRLWEGGIWGASVSVGGTRYYILPDAVVFKGWGLNPKYRDSDRKGRRSTRDVAAHQLKVLSGMTGLSVETLKEQRLSRFRTVSFIEETPGEGVLDLFRGNVLHPREFTKKQMIDMATKSADNLIRHQGEDGRFGYWYMTDDDEFSKKYGVVRHAGTVWGLFRIYKETGEQRFLDAANKGLEWLVRYAETPSAHPDMAIITSGGAALGTIALSALSIIEMPKELMSDELKELEEKLGNALVFMTHDDGRVYSNFSMAASRRLPKKQPLYFPGESALALLQLYKKDGKQKWLDAAKKICDFQIEEFERTGKPDNWIIQDLSHLYRITGEAKYLEYGYKTADYNVKSQWKPDEYKGPDRRPYADYMGGFDNSYPPRSTPAGSRTEAMDQAYALARFAKDEAAMKKYGDAVWQAMWFMWNHQYRPENAFYLRNPEAAMGGIKGGLIDNNIRIDYNQHIIMAVLEGLVVFDDRPGQSTASVSRVRPD